MKAIVLAAGRGWRLGSLTSSMPKALLPVLNKPLIHYILDHCDSICDEVVVVGGYDFYKLEADLSRRGGNYRLVWNREFLKGNLYSLAVALPYLEGDFVLANADHIYPRSLFQKFVGSGQAGRISVACDFDRRLTVDDMKIRLINGNKLTAIAKNLLTFDGGYIGMTLCQERKIYERAVEATFSRVGSKAVVEQVLETLIQWGQAPTVSDLSGIGWWEIDTPEELRGVEKNLKI